MVKLNIFLMVWAVSFRVFALSFSVSDAPSEVWEGEKLSVVVVVQGRAGDQGRIRGRLEFKRAALTESELSFRCEADGKARVVFTFTAPSLKPGLASKATLVFRSGDWEQTIPVHLFHSDVFFGQQEQLKALNLCLFDPGKSLSEKFKEAALPFTKLRSLEALPEAGATVIVGPEVKVTSGVLEALLNYAAAGNHIICTAVKFSNTPFPSGVANFSFLEATYIAELDLRLKPLPEVHSFMLTARKNRLMIESAENGYGYARLGVGVKGSLLFVAADIAECWETRPAAPLLLKALFDQATLKLKE